MDAEPPVTKKQPKQWVDVAWRRRRRREEEEGGAGPPRSARVNFSSISSAFCIIDCGFSKKRKGWGTTHGVDGEEGASLETFFVFGC